MLHSSYDVEGQLVEGFPMTWIKTVPPAQADPELKSCYEAVFALYPPEYHAEVARFAVRMAASIASSRPTA